MAQWTDYYRLVTPTSPKTSYVRSNIIDGNATAFANDSWYSHIMNGGTTRLQLYKQYNTMDTDADVSRALDTIAEEISGNDEITNLPFEIQFQNDDNKEVEESVVITIKSALRQWVIIQDLENRIFRIARELIKYGDCIFRKTSNYHKWKHIETDRIIGIEIDENGKPVNFHTRYNVGGGKSNQQEIIPSDGIIHFSLSDDMGVSAPFGDSLLKAAQRAYKQKVLLEDAAIIYTVVRAPERKVFYVDVGNMPPQKVKQYLESIKSELKQKRIPSPDGTGEEIDSVFNPHSMNEDYFFASTANGRGSRVETLPGGDGLLGDGLLGHFQDALFRILRIPTSYMKGVNNGGAQFNDGKTGIAYIEEQRFANLIQRIQIKMAPIFEKEFKLYLKNSGIQIDENLYRLKLPIPQNFGLYKRAELDAELINVYSSLKDDEYLSKRFLLKRYLGWSEGDIQINESLLRQELNIPETEKDSAVTDIQMFYDKDQQVVNDKTDDTPNESEKDFDSEPDSESTPEPETEPEPEPEN